MLNIVRINL